MIPRPMRADRRFWATLRPFLLAWPFAAVSYVAADLAGIRLSRLLDEGHRLPLIAVFPFAAALAATAPEAPRSVSQAVVLGQYPLYALVVRLAVRRGAPRGAGVAVVVLHAVGLVLASPLSWGPSLAAFERRLRQAAGPGAERCGVVPLRQDRSAAARRAQAALDAGRPFVVAFQRQGIDSIIYEGLASRGRGPAVLLSWDGDASGGGPLVPVRRMYERACAAPAIEDGYGAAEFRCTGTGRDR